MVNLKKETYLIILFLVSIVVLLTAYLVQYLLGYQPCNLCILERVPYALTLIILILKFKLKKDQVFYSVLLVLTFAFSISISLYHLGIEQGLFNESNICKTKDIGLITKEELLRSLQEIKISCKDVAFKVFGFSLTTYNMIVSTLMLLISTKI